MRIVVRAMVSRTIGWKHLPIAGLLAVASVVGLFLADDYGDSWDEHLNVAYGQQALKAYYDVARLDQVSSGGPTGPFAFMVAEVASAAFARGIPGWTSSAGRHFTYYLEFLASVGLVYLLSLRLSGHLAATVAAALMLTQPLLFGHAFINPKDIPFMAWFLAAVMAGLHMADAYRRPHHASGKRMLKPDLEPLRNGLRAISSAWHLASNRWKATFIGLWLLGLAMLLDLTVLHRITLPIVLETVDAAYHGRSLGLINQLFLQVAQFEASIPPVDYLWKAFRVYWRLRILLAIGLLLPPVVFTYRAALGNRSTSSTPLRLSPTLLAAVLLGLAFSTRVLAVYAGFLVSSYFIAKHRGRGWIKLTPYWLVAALVAVAARPSFWQSTGQRVWTSIRTAVDFPWEGAVLFNGLVYRGSELPASYSPLLLARQLTPPVLLLAIVGTVLWLWRCRRDVDRWLMLALLGLWSLVPLTAPVLVDTVRNDNFRQLLFALPPLFVISSVALEGFLRLTRARWPTLMLAVALCAAGIATIIRLHPYQYIYYSDIAGGVARAYRQLELDYWCTSYREAMEALNQTARPGAVVEVWGPVGAAKPFARSDIVVVPIDGRLLQGEADYALICARSNADQLVYPDAEVELRVELDGLVLAVVRRPPD